MSGFIAIFNRDGKVVDKLLLQRLTRALDSRGPDRQDYIIQNSVGMGHTLFKTTVEADYDQQPFVASNQLIITSNARIDGREELIEKLGIGNDIQANQTPDYQLILHAYKKWEKNCLDHLIGDFSFVIWDGQNQQLFCARDHFGMLQLHYAHTGNSVLISNSIYCLLQHPDISRRLNDQAMADYLLLGDHTWFDKSTTAFAEIQTLPPANVLIVGKDKEIVKPYWEFPLQVPLKHYKHATDYIEHFRHLLGITVKDRLRYPRVVISMSGGMDSSSVAAMASDIRKHTDPSIELNSVTSLFESIHPDNERYYSGLVSEKLDIPVHYIEGGNYPLFDFPEPTTRPMYILQPGFWLKINEMYSDLGRVLLTAEGADNLLTFTPVLKMDWHEINTVTFFFHTIKMYIHYFKFPGIGTGLLAKLRKVKKRDGINSFPAYPAPEWINKDIEKQMHLEERWNDLVIDSNKSMNKRHPKIHKNLVQPPWDSDDLCMHSSFIFAEKRDPFLDLRLLEFVLSIPPMPWLFNKYLLRHCMIGNLPEEVIRRKKTPIGMLHASLLKRPQNQWIDCWKPEKELLQYVNMERIPRMSGHHFDSNISYTHLLPLSLNNWLRGVVRN